MKIIVHGNKAFDAIMWCKENLKKGTWDVNSKWPADLFEFTIYDPKMLTLFLLKWSS